MKSEYEEILARRITPDTTVPQHDFLFRWGDRPCFARGELVALTGKAKSGKTFVCSILMALGVRPQLMGLSRLRGEMLRVVWIDTEQSEDSTHEILCHRIGSLIGQAIPEEQYYVYNLRRDNWQDRLHWAEMCIVQHKPDLVIFDGIRDVVGDINNYTEAQTVLDKLLSLASWSRACIVCVLHQNKALEDKTLRGALGTELQNKSYETYECQKDLDTRLFTLKQTATRKYDIGAKLEFTVNADGLPILEQRARNQDPRQNAYSLYASQIHAQEIIPKVFGSLTSMRAYDFKQKAMRCFPEVNCETAYRELLRQAYQMELIDKRKINDNETYYDLRSTSEKGQGEEMPSLF
ncbi:MAG: AAA family ATPase [Paludibacteraceae bacterium]|nr:AAA family ATPase [Paludibacteraceae bacterium]